jgi:hypothetical protein
MNPLLRSSRSFPFAAFLVAMLLLAAATRLPAALNPSEWEHRQTLDLTTPGLVKIPLPAETLDLALPDLDDLRLLGPAGEEVPYAVEIPATPEPTRQAPTTFRVRLQKSATELVIETGTTAPLDAVELDTPATTFIKSARLEISTDGNRWELIGDGYPLARQPGIDDTTLYVGRVAAAFLRVTIDDGRSAAIPFKTVHLILAAAEPAANTPVEAQLVKRDEFARETVLTLDLKSRHLSLAQLEFAVSDPLFVRSVAVTLRELEHGEFVERRVAHGTISRSAFPPAAAREVLGVPLNFRLSGRELQIHLANGSNAPLGIERIAVRRRPVRLVFRAPAAGVYNLLTGNRAATKPAYDLANFSSELLTMPESHAAIGVATSNPGFQTADPLASVAMLGPALDVGEWKFHKSVTVVSPGAQELELDLDVLAHARSDLGDLRLLRDGRQVPYLLERSSSFRSIALHPLPANDPALPRESRWRFQLPLASLPLRRLVLSSTTPLFSRRIELFELGTDTRGDSFHRPLADSVTWSSTPGQPNPTLTVDLRIPPQTESLYVATDNGDNPPIALGAAHADYTVTRLLFRTTDAPLDLHYGASGADAPRYDLQLVARSLLDEEKSRASLGPEIAAEKFGAHDHLIFKHVRSGVLLWSALGLVVVVLLVVIARLLPKPPANP